MTTQISLRAYAKHLKVDEGAIRKAISTNKIVKGVSYKTQYRMGKEVLIPVIVKEIADREYGYKHLPADELELSAVNSADNQQKAHNAYWVPASVNTETGLSGIDLLMWLALRPGMSGREVNRVYKLVSTAIDQEKLKLMQAINGQLKNSEVK